MGDTDAAQLLKILEKHGQSFLASFDTLSSVKKRTNDTDTRPKKRRKRSEEPEDEEEWRGIESNHNSDGSDGSEDIGDESNDEVDDNDDEFTSDQNASNVVVFSDISVKTGTTDPASKAQMKAFMSSKISKLSANEENPLKSSKTPKEDEDDRTNLQNDALLHKLVHTKLLSGSVNAELDLTPAKKRKALAGRILELTGDVKLGKGEKEIRAAERNKASKRVREGIAGKQKERSKQELEEAKNLGNYHQSLKKVFEASSSTSSNRNRQKGLGMGVGKFSNGLLRLSQADVSKAAAGTSDSFRGRRGSGRGRGRGRGGFKKRS